MRNALHRMLPPEGIVPALANKVVPITASLSPGGCAIQAKSRPPSAKPRRSPADSWLEITYPFASALPLRSAYVLPDGVSIRWGRLFEAFDALSGDVAYRHALDGFSLNHPEREKPLLIVTGAHDSLVITRLDAKKDLRLRSYPTGVSRSAMEVRTDVSQVDVDGVEEEVGHVFTVMVSRESDGKNGTRAAPLPPLDVTGDDAAEERQRQAMENQTRRRSLASSALTQRPPTLSELPVVHNHCVDGFDRSRSSNPVRMRDTLVSSSQIMQMDHRNVHGKMFGGYLMRKAFELAYMCAAKFNKSTNVEFRGFDDVFFCQPVNVGDFWEYNARVVFVATDTLRIRVDARTWNALSDDEQKTNEFYFIFRTSEWSKDKAIVPETYEEAMLWLEGRRRWQQGSETHS